MVTMTTAILTSVHGNPSAGECALFAAGGLLAFAVLEGVVAALPRSRDRDLPEATAFVGVLNLVSVGGGLAVAIAVAHLVDGWSAWLLAPLAATVVYMLLVGAQIAAIEDRDS
jgi:hypothetical protein